MKKRLLPLLALLLFLTGCAAGTPDRRTPPDSGGEETALTDLYAVPEGWVEAEAYSTEDKRFYVQEGHENDETPDNISVNLGTNRYGAEDHADFREAILRQLLAQIDGTDCDLTGDGTYTEQGYVVYIFTITENGTGIVTKQYYIVGDRRYCLVHLTSFTGDAAPFDAAQAIADSFVWDGEGSEAP